MSKQVMQRALDVLTESVDGVEADYTDAVDLYSNYPSRQACIDLLKEALDKHNAAIAELRAEIAKPVEPVGKQYQARDGTWHPFLSEKHATDTILDGTWPVRDIYTAPPDTEAILNNLRNAVNMFQTYVDGHVSPRTGQQMINALNAFIDKQGGGE